MAKRTRTPLEDIWNPKKLQALGRRAKRGDDMSVIIDLHLRVEHTLDEVIAHHAVNPEYLDVDNLNFARKLRIAVGFGLVLPHLYYAIAHLNTVRNRLAHDLEYRVTEEDADKMFITVNAYVGYPKEDVAEDRAVWEGKHLRRFLQYALVCGGMLMGCLETKKALDGSGAIKP